MSTHTFLCICWTFLCFFFAPRFVSYSPSQTIHVFPSFLFSIQASSTLSGTRVHIDWASIPLQLPAIWACSQNWVDSVTPSCPLYSFSVSLMQATTPLSYISIFRHLHFAPPSSSTRMSLVWLKGRVDSSPAPHEWTLIWVVLKQRYLLRHANFRPFGFTKKCFAG